MMQFYLKQLNFCFFIGTKFTFKYTHCVHVIVLYWNHAVIVCVCVCVCAVIKYLSLHP